jgi:hypothetical protein
MDCSTGEKYAGLSRIERCCRRPCAPVFCAKNISSASACQNRGQKELKWPLRVYRLTSQLATRKLAVAFPSFKPNNVEQLRDISGMRAYRILLLAAVLRASAYAARSSTSRKCSHLQVNNVQALSPRQGQQILQGNADSSTSSISYRSRRRLTLKHESVPTDSSTPNAFVLDAHPST